MTPSEPLGLIYEIRVKGHLDRHWASRFDNLGLRTEASGETVLSGVFRDQAALYGLLSWLRDLGVPLLLVRRVEPGDARAELGPASYHRR